MKKWLILFLPLVSTMFFAINVKAFTFDYDNFNISDTDINNLSSVRSYLDNNTTRPYNIVKVSSSTGYKVIFFNNNSSHSGNWYILSDKNSSTYYFTQYGFGVLNDNNMIPQNNYSNMIQDRSSGTSQAPILPYNASEEQLNSYLSELYNVINSNYYGFSNIFSNRYNSNNITIDFSNNNGNLVLYSSFDLPLVSRNESNFSFNSTSIIYNGATFELNILDSFVPYLNALDGALNKTVINSVKDFGNNTFGFYNNLVGIYGATLDGPNDKIDIICEEDKPFQNGYCSLDYNDFINKNSDISYFNNFGMSFTQFFGNNTGYLYNGKYYLYSFRIQKPFVPNVGNLFINTLKGTSIQTDILNVWALDGGSYTDYIVKFKIENSDYDSNTNLNDIMVVFRDGLGSYYNNNIPSTFNLSIYRAFKLQYFDLEPTNSDVSNFHNTNDLTTIEGLSNNYSFFTDNNFNSFGFGGIITAPFRFLYALENYESCTDINIPFPHSNQNLTLTCVRKNIPSSLNPLIVILQVVLSGIISYRIAVGTLNIIKDVSSPEDANIEVVDL